MCATAQRGGKLVGAARMRFGVQHRLCTRLWVAAPSLPLALHPHTTVCVSVWGSWRISGVCGVEGGVVV